MAIKIVEKIVEIKKTTCAKCGKPIDSEVMTVLDEKGNTLHLCEYCYPEGFWLGGF